MKARENGHELRKNVDGEERGYTKRGDGNKDWVHQSADYFAAKFVSLLQFFGKVREIAGKHTALLAHADEVDGKIAEMLAVLCERGREVLPAGYVFCDRSKYAFFARRTGLLVNHVHTLRDRHACLNEK